MAKKKTSRKPGLAHLWEESEMDVLRDDVRDVSRAVDHLGERLDAIEKAQVQNGVAQVFAIAAVGATAIVGFHYGVPAGGICALTGTMAAAVWQLVWHKQRNKEKDLF